MGAGRLNRKITIVRTIESQASNGEIVIADAPVRTVSAQLMEQRPGEVFSNGTDQDSAMSIFRIRWTEAIEPGDRLEYLGELFEIIGAPREVGRRYMLDLSVKRIGESGHAAQG